MRRSFRALSTLAFLAAACRSTPAPAPSTTTTPANGQPVRTNGHAVDAGATIDGSVGGVGPRIGMDASASAPEFTVTLLRLRPGTDPSSATATLPFAPRELADPTFLQLFDGATEVPRNVRVLARWPDGSIRTVLVGFVPPAVVGASSTITVRPRGGSARTIAGEPTASRSPTLRAFASFDRWASTGALGLPMQRANAGNYAPAFFRRAAPAFQSVANPPSGSNLAPHVRNYYDHTHALYMHMIAVGASAELVERIDAEVVTYREGEIVHTGARRGTYSAAPDTQATTPIDFNIVRRMYAQGLVEDFLLMGDSRSLDVAKEIADALVADVPAQTPYYTYTERIPAWTILGLLPVYEVTGDARYLTAAKTVAALELQHQKTMATKYPNQAGVAGLTGAFIQDRRNQWFDDSESTASGAGSPFMTTILVEALFRLYRDTGDASYVDAAAKAARWLELGCFVPSTDRTSVFTSDPDPASADDPTLRAASFRYVCRASDNRTVLPGLNPMFALALGLGWQRTGDEAYRTMARAVLAFEDWGNTIKEYNQSMRTAPVGFLLLDSPAGTWVPKP